MRRIKARAGFTLAEVIAAGALIAVIAGMTAIIIFAAINGFARSAKQDGARQLGLAVYELYNAQLNSAREITVNMSAHGAQLSVLDGKVFYARAGETPQSLYPDAMYIGARAKIELREQGGALRLIVEIFDESGTLFRKDSAFRPLTLERLGGAVNWPEGSGKSAENPVIFVN